MIEQSIFPFRIPGIKDLSRGYNFFSPGAYKAGVHNVNNHKICNKRIKKGGISEK